MIGDERELVAACSRGDARAWVELVERYQRLVYSIPRRYGLSTPDCDDVFQSVFASLLAHLASLRDGRSLPRWLITTAHRETWRRRRGAAPSLQAAAEPPDPGAPPFAELERLERQQLVHDAMRGLDERCEQLLRSMFQPGSGQKYDAVARELSMRPGSVGPTRLRCLEKLAAILEKNGALDAFKED